MEIQRNVLALIILLAVIIVYLVYRFLKYDSRGFDRKGIHKNGTKYDEWGYDVGGYDPDGYNRFGYDVEGYDRNGYNQNGYNQEGKNAKGQYNRFFDVLNYKTSEYNRDGFLNPKWHPVIVTNHAKQRMIERMSSVKMNDIEQLAMEAYCFGRGKRQIKRSSAAWIEEIENRYDSSVLLIYQGYIYIFSEDNKLITVYKNERILL